MIKIEYSSVKYETDHKNLQSTMPRVHLDKPLDNCLMDLVKVTEVNRDNVTAQNWLPLNFPHFNRVYNTLASLSQQSRNLI